MTQIKGYFLVTDPCYVFEGDEYDECCSTPYSINNYNELKLEGKQVFVANTCWGDGGYPVFDMESKEVGTLSVDSGMQCLINQGMEKPTEKNYDGAIVYLEGDLAIESGNFYLINGKVKTTITDTNGTEEDFGELDFDENDDEDETGI